MQLFAHLHIISCVETIEISNFGSDLLQRMCKENFKEYICRPFCKFFREGEKEELACQGAQVIEQMVRRRRLDPALLPRNGKKPSLWKNQDPVLVLHVCQHCPFQEKDCDYQSACPPPDTEPCGGYILLSLLKEKGLISTHDFEGRPDDC